MSSIDEKIKKFKETCSYMASEESKILSNQIDEEIEKNIKEEIAEYEAERKKEHLKKMERLEQKHNTELFQTDNNARYEILKKEKELKEKLYNKIINKIVEFTNGNKYKDFLNKNIKQTIVNLKIEEGNDAVLRITKKDMEKFGKELKSNYDVKFETIEDSNYGGSIGINTSKQILIDNSLKTQVEEFFK